MDRSQIDWTLFRSFLAVMRHGSLSAAARELGVAQPTIGRHIQEIEALAATPLFTRSVTGLMPTENALALLPHAETMEFSVAAIARALTSPGNPMAGTVRISASEMIAVEVLPPMIASIMDRFDGLEIELSSSDRVEDLLRREADIAIRMTDPMQDALLVRKVATIELGFFATRSYLERHGWPQSLADLEGHRLIGFDKQPAYVRSLIERYPEAGRAHFAFRADSNLAQHAALRAGCGIGMAQVGLAARHPDLQRLLPDFRYELPAWIAMHEDLKTSERCRRVFDALAEGLRDYARPQRRS